MATVYSNRGADSFPVPQAVGGGIMNVHWGRYDYATNLAAADVIRFLTLPARSTVVGGYLQGSDLDTHATEELDIDIGWQANGVESADPDGFGNMGVLVGDAVTELRPEAGIYRPLGGVLMAAAGGPQFFTAETNIIGTVNVDAATLTAGQLTLVVFYVCL
jgi:hypothetical protein